MDYGITFDKYDPTRESLEGFCKRLNRAQAEVREWMILMNIFEMKGWTSPITGEVRLVLRPVHLVAGQHVADAVEILDDSYKPKRRRKRSNKTPKTLHTGD